MVRRPRLERGLGRVGSWRKSIRRAIEVAVPANEREGLDDASPNWRAEASSLIGFQSITAVCDITPEPFYEMTADPAVGARTDGLKDPWVWRARVHIPER